MSESCDNCAVLSHNNEKLHSLIDSFRPRVSFRVSMSLTVVKKAAVLVLFIQTVHLVVWYSSVKGNPRTMYGRNGNICKRMINNNKTLFYLSNFYFDPIV